MKTSVKGRQLIELREGLRLSAYQDGAGVWTIGYGHTSAAGLPKVVKGLTITQTEASEILARDLGKFETVVAGAVKATLNQNEFDALVSICLNIGDGAFKGSTLVRLLNAGDRAGAADQFLVWNKITDPKTKQKVASAGLTNRRTAERKQYLTPITKVVPAPAPSPAPVEQATGWLAKLITKIFGSK